jgi:regulator of protease activity HflC (stomatin/prohibitin superfamily)
MVLGWIIGIFAAIIILSSIKIVYEFEKGVKFTLGRYSGLMSPGLRIVIPVIQTWQRIDTRVNVVDVPEQDCITKDNVSVRVNAVLYFKVTDANRSVISVEDYLYAVSQLSQTTMRNIIGEATLDQLLAHRDKISNRIEEIVDKATDPWGIKINSVDLKDIVLPENLQRAMARAAETERERRALIIMSDGEKFASENWMKAAKILDSMPGALHLRTLQNLSDISSDPSNTVVFVVPLETLGALEGLQR